MKTKKLISVIAAAALALTSFVSLAVTASAEDYTLRFDDGEQCLSEVEGTLPEVFEIPGEIKGATVLKIAPFAFRYHTELKTVIIPASVTFVGFHAFDGCQNLKEIVFLGTAESVTLEEEWNYGCHAEVIYYGQTPVVELNPNVEGTDVTEGMILNAGDVIESPSKPMEVQPTWIDEDAYEVSSYTLPDTYQSYRVKWIWNGDFNWSIELEPYVYVESVSFAQSSLNLVEGAKGSLAATVSPSDAYNKNLTWTSSDNSVATVSGSGVVTAKAAGTATITATSNMDNTKSASYTVTVTMPTTVTGKVTQVVANNDGNDGGATAFITTLTKSGDGEISISSVTWNVTSPAKDGASKEFAKTLPTMTFSGENTSATVALVIGNLYDAAATAAVTVD